MVWVAVVEACADGWVALVLSVVAFLTVNAHLSADNWQFVLGLRGKKVVALLIVGYAVGVSTLLFQTITHNPILTPSLLGFDAIYVLIQSVLVFVLGSVGFAGIPTLAKFGLEVGLMLGRLGRCLRCCFDGTIRIWCDWCWWGLFLGCCFAVCRR